MVRFVPGGDNIPAVNVEVDTSVGGGSGELNAGNALVANFTEAHIFITFEPGQSHPCFGDSGGPLLVSQSNRFAISGVVSQSDPQVSPANFCSEGDVTLYTNFQSGVSLGFLSISAPDAELI